MALVKGTNSYRTVAETETFMSRLVEKSQWDSKDTAGKEAVLMNATLNIDNEVYDVATLVKGQSLKFPLSYMDTVPNEVLMAVDYEAHWLCYNQMDLEKAGIKSPEAKRLMKKYIQKTFRIV